MLREAGGKEVMASLLSECLKSERSGPNGEPARQTIGM
ncbi:hypothetical protein SAMN05192533_108144 [Mesobacillus persicus]|uniref:Uncharacterized protein n=1 Tax=Mesobacillus persicus TaxID=930146 RepID=A0A1H8DAG7_9BACI|nr:hypothetical protein SAMN05192533_108144 [Mesobacillus persicus]